MLRIKITSPTCNSWLVENHFACCFIVSKYNSSHFLVKFFITSNRHRLAPAIILGSKWDQTGRISMGHTASELVDIPMGLQLIVYIAYSKNPFNWKRVIFYLEGRTRLTILLALSAPPITQGILALRVTNCMPCLFNLDLISGHLILARSPSSLLACNISCALL